MENNIFAENNEKINKYIKYKVYLSFGALIGMFSITLLMSNSVLWGILGIVSIWSMGLFLLEKKQKECKNNNLKMFHDNFISSDRRFNNIRVRQNREPYEYDYDLKDGKDNQNKNAAYCQFGELIYPNKNEDKKIIVSKKVKESINSAVCQIKNKEFVFNKWNYKSIEPNENKCILNFYGQPGTGKTLSAKELSKILDKPLLIVDYAQTESKMVGETEKNISEIFNFAKKHDAIILFDEADTLASKRVEDSSSSSRHVNSARNVFMQEVDKFDGILILTTNLFSLFDPAILSRISQHIEFELPTEEMRLEIIKAHIPKEVTLSENVNFNELAKNTVHFSGRDIKSFTKDAILMAVMDADSSNNLESAQLTQEHLLMQINKIKNSKDIYHKVDKSKIIGLQ